jgi:hypothetical protein
MEKISGFTFREKSLIFKFYNYILGINTRTSHFAANPTRECFFCSKMALAVNTDETVLHLFSTCLTTRNWQEQFVALFISILGNLDANMAKKLWFLGGV